MFRCFSWVGFFSVQIFACTAVCHANHGGDTSSHGQWAFQTPVRPGLPSVKEADWCINAIDSFVLHKQQQVDLSPSAPADPLTLLRRVTFDLTGLPPTRQQREDFLTDNSPDPYVNAVDRLLSSPAYGERWAQHWLDVVRYAETEGFKADTLRPNAYRYRDYVIQSLNADRPYDQFLRQQLAGDELEPNNPEALIATGLNRLYPDENNAANLFQRRDEILNDITETNSLALMALTMGCAQCHDHKFDEIPQVDYFRLRAFFAPLVERDDLPAATREEKQEYQRLHAVWDAETAEIRREMDDLLAEQRNDSYEYNLQKFRPEIQECFRLPKEARSPLQDQIARMALKQVAWRFDKTAAVKKLPQADQERYQQLQKRLSEFDDLKPAPLPSAMAVSDVGREPPPTYLLAGGNWRRPEQELKPGFPSIFGQAELIPLNKSASSGYRAALASWLTSEDHALTARVIVNRLWQHHFGLGIVPTPNDFGVMGQPPTHPELLDWLAVELVQHNWSLKHIHRLMVTSATYRQSSQIDRHDWRCTEARQVDSANQLLWHARRRRLEGEAIRDALLQVSSRLNEQMLGPSIRPPLPEGLSKRYAWKPDTDATSHSRRSIYVFVKRNMRFPIFDAFDLPDLHNSCGQRSTTTTAPQALVLLNSELSLNLARAWAERLMAECADDPYRLVSEAYLDAFGRNATQDEIAIGCQFVEEQTRRRFGNGSGIDAGSISVEAAADFCHALFNANEFLYID